MNCFKDITILLPCIKDKNSFSLIFRSASGMKKEWKASTNCAQVSAGWAGRVALYVLHQAPAGPWSCCAVNCTF